MIPVSGSVKLLCAFSLCRALHNEKGQYVFTDFPRGRVFHIDADGLVPGQLAEISL